MYRTNWLYVLIGCSLSLIAVVVRAESPTHERPLHASPYDTQANTADGIWQIVNGGFDFGLLGWDWSFTKAGEGECDATGHVEVSDGLFIVDEQNALHLASYALVEDQGVRTELTAGQEFRYSEGNMLSAIAAVFWGIELGPMTSCRIEVSMHLDNLDNGQGAIVPIKSLDFDWPHKLGVALSGTTGWLPVQQALDEVGAVEGDTLHVRFALQVLGESGRDDSSVVIYADALIDDVMILAVDESLSQFPNAPRITPSASFRMLTVGLADDDSVLSEEFRSFLDVVQD